ncbi:hypothetical protein AKJ29_08765 [Aliiroseovarius crassostreae]|uniref:Uncharacterized protein n=1 Tax=Aliiroseovarius crassostreae TaxID=154981 RepID=A0A0P7I0F4_9RHOB|nr:hypothetical protein AKJ29_08765 [Aliiroseovarius crassostreae]
MYAGHQTNDPFKTDRAIGKILRESRFGFQKPFHFGLCFKMTRGKTFQGLLDDGGQRFIAHQHVAMPCNAFVFVPNRRTEHPISIERTATHTVLCLLTIFLPLVLRHRRQ